MFSNTSFEKFKRVFIGPVLYSLLYAIKFLSNFYSCNISPSPSEQQGYKTFAINDDFVMPTIEKPKKVYYEDLLEKAANEGTSITPVNRKKPFNAPVDKCPNCDAPKEYLYSFGHDPKSGHQKIQCKVCKAQRTPGKKTKKQTKPTLYCPHCGRAIAWKKKRKDFIVYKCINPDCSYKKNKGKRYTFNKYLLDEKDLVVSSPAKAKVNLNKTHSSGYLMSRALSYVINFGMSFRQAAQLIMEEYQVSVTHQTVNNWVKSFAAHLNHLAKKIQLPLSHLVVVDETYIKVNGKWGYLFTAIDGVGKFIITQHFSMNRDAKAAMTLLNEISKIHNKKDFILVTDKAPIYNVAVNYLKFFLKREVKHRQVKGLTDPENGPKNPYRKYKNLVERYFGTYKSHYKRLKSFQSIEGAIAHSILYGLYYNHLKPHDDFNNDPPLPLKINKREVSTWQQLINYLVELNKS